MSAETEEDRLFRAWRDTFPEKHWSKTDLGACRLGWDAGRAVRPAEGGEPVAVDPSATAWMREGKGRPIDVTLFHEVAEVWTEDGYEVTPLFASGSNSVSAEVTVTDEMVERAIAAYMAAPGIGNAHLVERPFYTQMRAALLASHNREADCTKPS